MAALTKIFSGLTLDKSVELAHAIGCLSQALYSTNVNNVLDKESGKDIFIVGLKGNPGVGKSVYSGVAVLQNICGENEEGYSGQTITFEADEEAEARTLTAYESYWSLETQQENRTMDAMLVECPYTFGDMTKFKMKPRQYPGLEIVEHPFEVPLRQMGVFAEIIVEDQKTRAVEVSVPCKTKAANNIWDQFLDFTNDI